MCGLSTTLRRTEAAQWFVRTCDPGAPGQAPGCDPESGPGKNDWPNPEPPASGPAAPPWKPPPPGDPPPGAPLPWEPPPWGGLPVGPPNGFCCCGTLDCAAGSAVMFRPFSRSYAEMSLMS